MATAPVNTGPTNMKSSIAKAGTLLSVESGAYSNRGVDGFFVVLRDFDPQMELAEFLAANLEQRKGDTFSGEKLLAAILAKGLLLEINTAFSFWSLLAIQKSFISGR